MDSTHTKEILFKILLFSLFGKFLLVEKHQWIIKYHITLACALSCNRILHLQCSTLTQYIF
nr:MAG TPA: hypothetical protein [Caudoviricetes sp.]